MSCVCVQQRLIALALLSPKCEKSKVYASDKKIAVFPSGNSTFPRILSICFGLSPTSLPLRNHRFGSSSTVFGTCYGEIDATRQLSDIFRSSEDKNPEIRSSFDFSDHEKFHWCMPHAVQLVPHYQNNTPVQQKVKHYADMLMSLPVSCKTCSQPQTACEQAMPGVATT